MTSPFFVKWRRRAVDAEQLSTAVYHYYPYENRRQAACGLFDSPLSEDDYTQTSEKPEKPYCWKCCLIYHTDRLLDKASKPIPLGFYSGACFGVFTLICLMASLFESMAPMYVSRPDLFLYDFMSLTGQLAGYFVGGLVFIKMLFFFLAIKAEIKAEIQEKNSTF